VAPGTDPVDPIDGDVDDKSRWGVPPAELGTGTDVELGKPVHHRKRAAFGEASSSLNYEVWMKFWPGVLGRFKGDCDAGIAAYVFQLVLVRKSREYKLISFEPSPREGHVRSSLGIEGDKMAKRPFGKELADLGGDDDHATIL
jgi:hypothetical protein